MLPRCHHFGQAPLSVRTRWTLYIIVGYGGDSHTMASPPTPGLCCQASLHRTGDSTAGDAEWVAPDIPR